MGIPWKKIFSLGLAGAGKIAALLPGKFGSVTGTIVDEIHNVEAVAASTGLVGADKFLYVETAGIDAINAAFAAAGKQPVIDDDLEAKQKAFIEAAVALENAIADRVHKAPAVAA